MAPLIQPITDLLSYFATILALALIPTTMLAILMRMLRWLGFDMDSEGGE